MTPDILIIAADNDRAIAGAMRAALAPHMPNIALAPDADAGALATLIVISEDWSAFADNAALANAAEAALRNPRMMTIAVVMDGAEVPDITDLPEALRGLAYTTRETITRDTLTRDMRRIGALIRAHKDALEPDRSRPGGGSRGRRAPTNLLIVFTAVLIGLILVAIIRIRRASDDLEPLAISAGVTEAGVDELVIGVAAGVSGVSEARGETMVNGVLLALAERPSVSVGGRDFAVDIVTADTRCSGVGGLDAATLFAESEIAGVVGHLCESSCAAAAPVYDAAGITAFSPACTAPGLTDLFDGMNRTVPAQDERARAAADFALDGLGVGRAAVIADEIVLGGQLASTFAGQLFERGGEISGFYSVETTTLDIDDALETLLREGPEVVYFAGRVSTAASIVAALDAAGLHGLPVIVGIPADRERLVELIDVSVNNQVYMLDLLAPDAAALAPLEARYREQFGADPADPVYAYSYNAATLLLDAVEASGRVDEAGALILDRDALAAAARAGSTVGAAGALACAPDGECATGAYRPLVIDDGAWVEFVGGDEAQADE